MPSTEDAGELAGVDVAIIGAAMDELGLLHFDTHTDTATQVFGVEVSHGSPMYHLVPDGHVDPRRYAQVGLRGYWPGPEELSWQAEQGVTAIPMHEVRAQGIAAALERALAVVGDGPAFLTVDVDVLDPAFAPGTGTPEPGGMTHIDLLWAYRKAAEQLALVIRSATSAVTSVDRDRPSPPPSPGPGPMSRSAP
jgi:agmatinase